MNKIDIAVESLRYVADDAATHDRGVRFHACLEADGMEQTKPSWSEFLRVAGCSSTGINVLCLIETGLSKLFINVNNSVKKEMLDELAKIIEADED